MKKVIFSAIAMIAFVGSSMANDIAEKEVIITESQKLVSEFVGPKDDELKFQWCVVTNSHTLDIVLQVIEMSDEDTYYWWQAAMDYCMAN